MKKIASAALLFALLTGAQAAGVKAPEVKARAEISPQALEHLHEQACVDPLIDPDFKPVEPAVEVSVGATDLFGKVLAADEATERALFEADEAVLVEELCAMGVQEPAQQALFLGAVRMKPLFDSGVIYQAIANQCLIQGFKTKADAETLLRRFYLLSAPEKREFIEGVIEGIMYAMDDRIDFKNIKDVRTRARLFAMKEDTYSKFLVAWRRMHATQYEEARLVLFNQFKKRDDKFIKEVLKAHQNFVGFRWFGWFRGKRPAQRPKPPAIVSGSAGTYHDNLVISNFLINLFPSFREYFIRRHFPEFNTAQLISLSKQPFWEEMPADIKALVAVIRKADDGMTEAREAVEKAESNVKNLETSLEGVRQKIKQAHATKESVDISAVLSQVQAASKIVNYEDRSNAIATIVSSNGPRLSGTDYLKMVSEIVKMVSEIKESPYWWRIVSNSVPNSDHPMKDDEFKNVILTLIGGLKATKSDESKYYALATIKARSSERGVSVECESAIKDAVAQLVATTFTHSGHMRATLQLFAPKWEHAPPKAKTAADLAGEEKAVAEELAQAKTALDQAKAELEKKTPGK